MDPIVVQPRLIIDPVEDARLQCAVVLHHRYASKAPDERLRRQLPSDIGNAPPPQVGDNYNPDEPYPDSDGDRAVAWAQFSVIQTYRSWSLEDREDILDHHFEDFELAEGFEGAFWTMLTSDEADPFLADLASRVGARSFSQIAIMNDWAFYPQLERSAVLGACLQAMTSLAMPGGAMLGSAFIAQPARSNHALLRAHQDSARFHLDDDRNEFAMNPNPGGPDSDGFGTTFVIERKTPALVHEIELPFARSPRPASA